MSKGACWLFLSLGSFIAGPSRAQTGPTATSDEIVVTAQRSGIPVWRVHGGAGTLVLIGTIQDVAKGTDWNPDALAAALRQADQVMFPEAVQLTGGFFSIMGAKGKVRRMEGLPAGETLASYLPAAELQRLLALRDRSVLKPGFELRRPLFVAYDLMQAGKGEQAGGFLTISRVDWKTDPEGFVRSTINKYHLKLVPMRKESVNGALARIAALAPAAQTPCLVAAARFAEAGPGAFQARSQAWAARRVRDVIASPAEKAFATCGSMVRKGEDRQAIDASLLSVLRQAGTTVAVLEISTLAAPGGVLDTLEAAGFEVAGPAWK